MTFKECAQITESTIVCCFPMSILCACIMSRAHRGKACLSCRASVSPVGGSIGGSGEGLELCCWELCSSLGVNCRGVKPSPGMVEIVVGVQLDVEGSVSGEACSCSTITLACKFKSSVCLWVSHCKDNAVMQALLMIVERVCNAGADSIRGLNKLELAATLLTLSHLCLLSMLHSRSNI